MVLFSASFRGFLLMIPRNHIDDRLSLKFRFAVFLFLRFHMTGKDAG